MCGWLTPNKQLTRPMAVAKQIHVLHTEGVTRKERRNTNEQFEDLAGPVVDNKYSKVCEGCCKEIWLGKIPCYALANGLCIGEVPKELQNLQYIEKLLIQKVHVHG